MTARIERPRRGGRYVRDAKTGRLSEARPERRAPAAEPTEPAPPAAESAAPGDARSGRKRKET